MDAAYIELVRRFNRAITLRTGALDESYLGRGRPLGLARLLFEIGPDGAELAALRQRLNLDSGYASRLLRSLKQQRLVEVDDDPEDRRRRRVALTPAGLEEWRAYDAMSVKLAHSMIEPLGPTQRERLAEAMMDVERLLAASSIMITPEPAYSAEAKACLNAYFGELNERFEGGFEPGSEEPPTPPGCFLIARLEGKPIGCGMLKALNAETGEIKRMWVAPEARGLGLSRRLLAELEDRAVKGDMRRVTLDTNRVLAEAQALYRKTGYREIARYNDNPYAHLWFEKEFASASV